MCKQTRLKTLQKQLPFTSHTCFVFLPVLLENMPYTVYDHCTGCTNYLRWNHVDTGWNKLQLSLLSVEIKPRAFGRIENRLNVGWSSLIFLMFSHIVTRVTSYHNHLTHNHQHTHTHTHTERPWQLTTEETHSKKQKKQVDSMIKDTQTHNGKNICIHINTYINTRSRLPVC